MVKAKKLSTKYPLAKALFQDRFDTYWVESRRCRAQFQKPMSYPLQLSDGNTQSLSMDSDMCIDS